MFSKRTLLVLAAALALLGSVARPSSGAGAERKHVVRPGETLWTIADATYGGDPRAGVWRITERNGLSSARLSPGMVLVLPP